MPALTITDYVLTGAGRAGVYVQLRDNASAAIFTSAVATDSNGQFSIAGSPPPPADYAAYISVSLVAPIWTLYDPHFRIAYTKNDDAVLNTLGATMWDIGGAATNVRHPNFAAKCDAYIGGLGSINNGSTAFASDVADLGVVFTQADVGKLFSMPGAGVAGADLRTTITAFVDAHHVTLGLAASTTVVNGTWYYCSPGDAAKVQAAIDSLGTHGYNSEGGTVVIPGLTGIEAQVNPRARVEIVGRNRDVSGLVAMGAFPINTALIWLGTIGNVLSFGSRVRNMRVDANNYTGSTCIYTERINEQSGVFNVVCINWMSRGLNVQPPGVGLGAQNFVVDSLECIGGYLTPVGAIGVEINCTGQGSPSELEHISVVPLVGHGLTTGILMTAMSATLGHAHVEQCVNAVDVNGCNVPQIFDLNAGPNVTNAVNWRANNAGNSLVVIGVQSGGSGFSGFAVVDLVNGINAGPPGLTMGFYIVGTGGVGQQPVYTSDNAVTQRMGSTRALADFARSTQAIVFAAAITPNAKAGEFITVGSLTGNMTINAPLNPLAGQVLTFRFQQDGVGGRTLTWNAVFLTFWQPHPSANATSTVSFFYDGATWQQLFAVATDQFDNIYVQQVNARNGVYISSGTLTVLAGTGSFGAQIYPAAEATGIQSTGGILHAVAVPSNANGNNNDFAISDNGNVYFKAGGVWAPVARPSVTAQTTPANPALTASLVGVMMGLAGSITPKSTGKVKVTLSGDLFNSVINDGVSVQLSFGTGAAPVNGAALAGTQVGGKASGTMAAASQKLPFSLTWIITGLTLGTAYWLDAAVAAITGGNASIENLALTAVEV